MSDKQQIIDRLTVLQQESGLCKQEFKKVLANITGKTPRTLRRWYALETIIQDSDINKIATHFGLHQNWLKYGDKDNHESLIDQIMTSNHFGAVVLKDGLVERTNHKFNEMMKLSVESADMLHACEMIMGKQSEETTSLCSISRQLAEQSGAHHITMIMLLGDQKHHTVDVTTLNLNNGRILRILMDKGQVY